MLDLVTLPVLLIPTCISSGHVFNSGLIQSYMSSIAAPGKFLTLTFPSLFNILLSLMPYIIKSPAMTVVFLLHFWRLLFESGDACKFLLLFLTKFNKLVLNPIYWFVFYIPKLLISSFECFSLCFWFSVISLYVLFLTVK